MAEVRPELQALDRDELLGLCELLAVTSLTTDEKLDRLILHARWTVAQNRVLEADRKYTEAFNHWADLISHPGKLTAARLAEREKAERRHRRLDAVARRTGAYERELWGQISAEWRQGGEEV